MGSIISFAVFAWHRVIHASERVVRTNSTNLPKLEITRTSHAWFGQPVYVLKNESAEILLHLVIESWNGDQLPILSQPISISALPGSKITFAPQNLAPFDFQPGKAVYFSAPVLSHMKNSQIFTIMWMENGLEQYENVNVS
ncbi:hypothetical protein FY534_01680 [Alicyclobacillus sp. TC]|uniref:Uncharacterized protein n=1 Tax=Alicyclobacillus tolerans TaxID=90970 RepID=A0ABT9LWB8_9BACL|nr:MULTISPECIES: hypothetical protein [Alicyclobacillus]MDP9728547.1 hypothetical protein [Alicyclobacillus tengchongensis]QRF22536.1 hypothetical protein FY534_01680 [Alicyclobacillus sp. TC]